MAQLAQGERAAFDPLFRALHPRALRLARAKLGEAAAPDAAQAALERVFFRAGEFEPGRPVLPWFYAIVANEIRSLARRYTDARALAEREAGALWAVAPDDPERLHLERELHDALERAIASLDGASAGAIGTLLGRRGAAAAELPSDAAFRKRVSRAYARLRLLLGGFDGN